ncbi:MAG: CpsD/CapB family tyrosine-protein kinase [Bryobacteraceae bacterium]
MRQTKPLQTVLITSSVPAEGKTSVAANLAHVLTRHGSRVLLLDADLRAPDLPRMLGLPSSLPGLTDFLDDEIQFEAALRCISPLELFVLAAGKHVEDPLDKLESPSFKFLLNVARETFEWIIIDSPPLAPFADAHHLASLVDGVFLVVRWGMTPRRELEQSVASMAGLPLRGMILNAYDQKNHDDYYNYYQSGRTVRPTLFSR